MRRARVLVPLAPALLVTALVAGTRAQDRDAPRPPAGFLFRPTICPAGGEETRAGHAFAAEVRVDAERTRTLVLTCLHLFGPAGGLPEQLRGDELHTALDRLELADPLGGRPALTLRRPLALPGAYVADAQRENAGGDVAAFFVEDPSAVAALPLATAAPEVGERVWLWAQLSGERAPRAHAAEVVEVTENELVTRYEAAQVELRGTSGAPWLDRRGRVVGINSAGGESEGRTYGIAVSAPRVNAVLRGARLPRAR